MIPSTAIYSCKTPVMEKETIAGASKPINRARLKALPNVCPIPFSKGSATNRATLSTPPLRLW